MTVPAVGTLAVRLVRRAVAATCGCAARQWQVDVSRSFAGVKVRAQVRSQ
jgi:hypothetical protein